MLGSWGVIVILIMIMIMIGGGEVVLILVGDASCFFLNCDW